MKRLAPAVLLVTCVATNAHSQKETFSIGVTGMECTKLLSVTSESDSPRSDMPLAMVSWIEGYVTAMNIGLKHLGQPRYDLGSMTINEIWASLYGFCKRNPDKQVMQGTTEIVDRMKREAP
jgi:hypothetical protein